MQTVEECPRISAWWIRGHDYEFMKFRKPYAYLGLGQKEAGKSAFLEAIAYRYPKIIDLFGSRDSEGLAWCRSPLKDSILFITGDSVDVKSQWDAVRISNLKLRDFRKYDVMLSVSAFHPNVDSYFYAMNRIVDTLYQRFAWDQVWCLMVREASNFLYSRLKVSQNQTLAKADFLYLLREARHMGYAVGVDTIRWTGIDADARGVADYVFIKSLGIDGLPKDLRWLYGLIEPISLSNIHPRALTLVSRRGPVALCTFELPKWHKKEGEDMLSLFDIHREVGDVPDYGQASRNTVSDFEHIKLVATYMQTRSMAKVAKALVRSPRTVNDHITQHDLEVGKLGYCVRCKRVRGEFASTPLIKSVHPLKQLRQVEDDHVITTWEEFEKTFEGGKWSPPW